MMGRDGYSRVSYQSVIMPLSFYVFISSIGLAIGGLAGVVVAISSRKLLGWWRFAAWFGATALLSCILYKFIPEFSFLVEMVLGMLVTAIYDSTIRSTIR